MSNVFRGCIDLTKVVTKQEVEERLRNCDADIDYLVTRTDLARDMVERSVQDYLQCRNACATHLGLECRGFPDLSHIPLMLTSPLTGRIAELSSQR